MVALISIPVYTSYKLEQWLALNGGENVSIGNIDFNPFTGLIILEELQVFENTKKTMSINELKLKLSVRKLFQRKLEIMKGTLSKLIVHNDFSNPDEIQVGGIILNKITKSDEISDNTNTPFVINIQNFEVSDAEIIHKDSKLTTVIHLTSLEINDFSNTPYLVTDIELSGTINSAPFALFSELDSNTESLNIKGQFGLENLQIAPFSELVSNQIQLLDATLSLNQIFAVKFSDSGSFNLAFDGKGIIKDINLTHQLGHLSTNEINWNGQAVLKKDDTESLISVIESTKPFRIQGLSYSENNDHKAAILNTDLYINAFNFTTKVGLHVDEIILKNLSLNLNKVSKDEWNIAALLKSKTTTPSKTTHEDKLSFAVDSFKIMDSNINIKNDYLSDKFKQTLKINTSEIKNINSSDKNTASQLSVDSNFNQSALLINGEISLFKPELEFDIETSISSLSLLPFNFFIGPSIGYKVESGNLSAESEFKAESGLLTSLTKLELHQFDLMALSKEELKNFDIEQNTFIESGLSMLKDDRGTIKLELPINGKFENLKLDSSDILNQALSSALKSGAKTYLAASLFPFGTFLVIADAVTDKAMEINLDPVIFVAGTSTLSDKQQPYLKKVAELLNNKKDYHLKICALSVHTDKNELQKVETAEGKDQQIIEEQLLNLADQRSEVIRNSLIEGYKVEASQLIACQSKVLSGSSEQPSAHLIL